MNWYLQSQSDESDLAPIEPGVEDRIFIEDVEDMFARMFNQNKEYMKEEGYGTWKQWVQNSNAYELSLVIDSDTTIYDLYLKDLPDGMMAIDIVRAYKAGLLRHKTSKPTEQYRMDLSDKSPYESKVPWHYKKNEHSNEELVHNFSVARNKVTKSISDQVYSARKVIFLAFNSRKDLPQILGVSSSELKKLMLSWSGLSAGAIKTQLNVNLGVGEEHQWNGLQNVSFLNMRSVNPEDIDKFVNKVVVPGNEQDSYRSYQGEYLRKLIMNSFMAIDTGLSYSDLSFVVKRLEADFGKKNPPLGRYVPTEKAIYIGEVGGGTVAHEIGHYLDHKFALAFGEKFNSGLSETNIVWKGSPERLAWKDRYKDFVRSLALKGDIGSEYHQKPGEVFSRFVADFVLWTTNSAKMVPRHSGYLADKFDPSDFIKFIKLLQEKSYIDRRFPSGNPV